MVAEYKGMSKAHHPEETYRKVCQLLASRALKEKGPNEKPYTLRSISAITGVPEPTIGNWKRLLIRQIHDLILDGVSLSEIARQYEIREEAIHLLINVRANDIQATEGQIASINELSRKLGRTIAMQSLSATLAQQFIEQLSKKYDEHVAIEKLLSLPTSFSVKLEDGRTVVTADVARAIIEIRAGRPYDPSTTARLIKTKRVEYKQHAQGNLYFVESLKNLHLVPSHVAQKKERKYE